MINENRFEKWLYEKEFVLKILRKVFRTPSSSKVFKDAMSHSFSELCDLIEKKEK